MKIVPFKAISTSSQELDRVQQNVEQALKPLAGQPILNNIILENISIATGTPKTINHGLNRKLLGWIIIRIDAGATVWDSQDDNTTPERTLILNASADVNVSLLVF